MILVRKYEHLREMKGFEFVEGSYQIREGGGMTYKGKSKVAITSSIFYPSPALVTLIAIIGVLFGLRFTPAWLYYKISHKVCSQTQKIRNDLNPQDRKPWLSQ